MVLPGGTTPTLEGGVGARAFDARSSAASMIERSLRRVSIEKIRKLYSRGNKKDFKTLTILNLTRKPIEIVVLYFEDGRVALIRWDSSLIWSVDFIANCNRFKRTALAGLKDLAFDQASRHNSFLLFHVASGICACVVS